MSFELNFIEVIKKYIGAGFISHIKINFPAAEVVQIDSNKASKSGKPIFTQYEGRENFFVRSGCSSQPLCLEAQSAYEKIHWGNI